MYKIAKIGENVFYLKAVGMFPPSIAKEFVKEFRVKTKKLPKFSVNVDRFDLIMLNLKSFKIILKLLKKTTIDLKGPHYFR